MRRLLGLGFVLITACGTTEPKITPAPALQVVIETPARNSVIPDTIVTIKGYAESPDSVYNLYWAAIGASGQGAAGGEIYFDNEGKARIPFSVATNLGAGDYTLLVTADDKAGKTYQASLAFKVYRKPTIQVISGVQPTLYQRSLMLLVQMDGITPSWTANLVIDAGTAAERIVDNRTTSTYIERLSGQRARLYYPDVLAGGPHTVEVRLYEVTGLAETKSASFVISIPERRYLLDTLPSLGGDARAVAINDAGDIAGRVFDPAAARNRAAVWRSGVLEVLDTAASSATAIDRNGRVAGKSGSCGMTWDAGTKTPVLDTDGVCVSTIADINNVGAVLAQRGLQWMLVRPGGVTNLPLDGALDVNDADQVVGWTIYTTGGSRAAGYGVEIPPIPGAFRLPNSSPHYAEAVLKINNRGEMLSESGSPAKLALLKPGQEPTILSPIFGVTAGILKALGEDGSVLAFDSPSSTGFLYDGARTYRITTEASAWRLDGLSGMNAAGKIIGHAVNTGTGQQRAVLLTPVP